MSWPLHWLRPAGFRTTGAFKLCLMDEPNRSYEEQASTNLGATNWTALGVMENTNGSWRFLDTSATNQAWRLYRALQLP